MSGQLSARILKDQSADLEFARNALNSGLVISLPTETVYGLACDALNKVAVKTVFDIKDRPLTDPLIVHVDSLKMACTVAVFSDRANRLAKHFWPGPLTMILPKKACVPSIVCAGLPTVGVRSPSNVLMQKVLKLCGFPLAAPSANPFGYISPTSPEPILKTLGDKVSGILDGGTCQFGVESTVVDLSDPSKIFLLRPGPISSFEIEKVLSEPVLTKLVQNNIESVSVSPGQHSKHYSPRTSLFIFENEPSEQINENDKIVYLQKTTRKNKNHYYLSKHGDWKEICHSLFGLLYRLDQDPSICRIFIQVVKDDHPYAIIYQDRVHRAASKSLG